jgi:hypothetical protein
MADASAHAPFEPLPPVLTLDPIAEISQSIERLRYSSKQLMKAGDFKSAAMVEKLFIEKLETLQVLHRNESARIEDEIEALHFRRN